MYRRSFLAILAAPALRAQPGPALAPEQSGEIERLIAAEMARQGIPGMTAAIFSNGGLRWSAGYGLADLENFVPARAAAVYRTASIAKPITAVAAMQLVEEGRLDLDAPVQKYVPQFPVQPWPLTIRHLLGHLGGIRWYKGEEFNSTRQHQSLTSAVAVFAADPLEAEPGTRYIYSSYGYVLVGAAIETATGLPFGEVLRRNVFEPAGMMSTRVDSVADIIPNRVRGYARTEAGGLVNCALANTSNRVPGGGLVSTASDIARFALAVGSGALLETASLDQMWTPMRTRDGKSTGYGLGWGIGEWRGQRMVSHNGGQAGVSTHLRYLPEQKMALTLMFNLEGVKFDQLADGMLAAVAG